MRSMDRRGFLAGTAGLGAAVLLPGCGSGSSSGSQASTSRPKIGSEPGNLTILEWDGYQAAGTKAQTYKVDFGKDYTDAYGTNGLVYSLITNDSDAINKVRTGSKFDLLHPCAENFKDYVDGGFVQPFDTSLIPSFANLNPALVKGGQFNGQQYAIPWDWGYGSVIYRTDKVDPADATGWELFWNPKYKGRISMWNGATTNFEIAALKLGFPQMDNLTSDQLDQATQSLIDQKPLNKLLWKSEYTDLQPALQNGDIWIAYSWQDQWYYGRTHKPPIPFTYMQPSQGRLGWYCGFMLGKDTANYYHAHKYVESYINHAGCLSLTNTFAYGSADATVKPSEISDPLIAKSLDIGDPNVLADTSKVHLQSWEANEVAVQTAWEKVVAA
jgi:spermidine/putrescine transport system substrate-binding protein